MSTFETLNAKGISSQSTGYRVGFTAAIASSLYKRCSMSSRWSSEWLCPTDTVNSGHMFVFHVDSCNYYITNILVTNLSVYLGVCCGCGYS